MNDKVKIRVKVRTNKVGSACEDIVEFDREEWEEMTDQDKEDELFMTAMEMAEWNWEEVE